MGPTPEVPVAGGAALALVEVSLSTLPSSTLQVAGLGTVVFPRPPQQIFYEAVKRCFVTKFKSVVVTFLSRISR